MLPSCIRLLVLALALVACQHDSNVGGNDGAPGGGDGPLGCVCGPESCGARICGRSACGYECGSCNPGDWCFLGTQCQAGPGPGTTCVDVLGDPVWEGDRGLRQCPSDPTRTQLCTCTGGGPDAWASCDACTEFCPGGGQALGIACVMNDCMPFLGACCLSAQDPSITQCSATASCPPDHYTRRCDGPEDCEGTPCCGGDAPWTATCTPGPNCGSVTQFCHDSSQCPTALSHCCPYSGTDVKACSATDGPGCT